RLFTRHPPAGTSRFSPSLHDALPIFAWRRDNHLHAEPLRERVTVGHEARRLPAFEVALKVVAPVDGLDADVVNRQPRLVDSVVGDRKSTRLNSSHVKISYAVFCLKKK